MHISFFFYYFFIFYILFTGALLYIRTVTLINASPKSETHVVFKGHTQNQLMVRVECAV